MTIQEFTHINFGNITVVTKDDNTNWFVASEVCRVLGLAHTGSALRILDDDEKGVHNLHTPGGYQNMTIISEPGLYKLIARSRKPEARVFDRWVRHEVLPKLRQDDTLRNQFNYNQYFAQQLELIKNLVINIGGRQERQFLLLENNRTNNQNYNIPQLPHISQVYLFDTFAKEIGINPNDLFKICDYYGLIDENIGVAMDRLVISSKLPIRKRFVYIDNPQFPVEVLCMDCPENAVKLKQFLIDNNIIPKNNTLYNPVFELENKNGWFN